VPSITVMSFNIRGSFVDDGVNVWPNRRDLAARVIRQEAPDLIGLQEVQDGNWAFFAEAFADYEGRKGPPYNNGEPFCYPSILWRRDVLEPLDEGAFWLSETPAVFSASWETACVRSALWIRFRRREDGREFVHLNTHLDHVSEPARLNGAGLIVDRLVEAAGASPRLITADFNCKPGSPVHHLFLEAGYQDAHLAAGGTDGPDVFTFHAFTGQRELGRIDWVLCSPDIAVRTCRTITDADPPVYPSDHFPIVAGVFLP